MVGALPLAAEIQDFALARGYRHSSLLYENLFR